MAAQKKIVADNPLLSHFGMDNRTHEGVTERTDKHFPLSYPRAIRKRVSRAVGTTVQFTLDTLFLMALG